MLDICTKMFMQVPDKSKKGTLHPATIIEKDDNFFTAELEEETDFGPKREFAFDVGQEIFVYHEIRQEFMKQSALVEEIVQTDPIPVICFKTTSEPVSAENRQCYRVSTVIAELVAKFGPEENCPLLDVSATGFAVSSRQCYEIANTVEVTLYYEDHKFSGAGSIQSVLELSPGRFRYGLLCTDDKSTGGNLQKGLEFISSAVQRQQLQRLSGAV